MKTDSLPLVVSLLAGTQPSSCRGRGILWPACAYCLFEQYAVTGTIPQVAECVSTQVCVCVCVCVCATECVCVCVCVCVCCGTACGADPCLGMWTKGTVAGVPLLGPGFEAHQNAGTLAGLAVLCHTKPSLWDAAGDQCVARVCISQQGTCARTSGRPRPQLVFKWGHRSPADTLWTMAEAQAQHRETVLAAYRCAATARPDHDLRVPAHMVCARLWVLGQPQCAIEQAAHWSVLTQRVKHCSPVRGPAQAQIAGGRGLCGEACQMHSAMTHAVTLLRTAKLCVVVTGWSFARRRQRPVPRDYTKNSAAISSPQLQSGRAWGLLESNEVG